jgi:hypothetical protein
MGRVDWGREVLWEMACEWVIPPSTSTPCILHFFFLHARGVCGVGSRKNSWRFCQGSRPGTATSIPSTHQGYAVSLMACERVVYLMCYYLPYVYMYVCTYIDQGRCMYRCYSVVMSSQGTKIDIMLFIWVRPTPNLCLSCWSVQAPQYIP